MIFNEDLLQFIWEKKYFDTSNLLTVCGKKIHIKDTGTKNNDQGPDFLNARIFIENTEWAGNIELHIKTSEWILHKHQDDNNYRNIILHVVWENNLLSFQQSPVLELVNYISIDWLSRCQVLMNNNFNIPCISFAHQPPDFQIKTWLNELGIKRTINKSDIILSYLNHYKGDWEEVIWIIITKNFGYRVNSESFFELAKSIPFFIIKKYKDQINLLEALLMGQAGLLKNNFKDYYPQKLLQEYTRFKTNYSLKPITYSVNFLRMRPVNFPTIRLAQLSMIISRIQSIITFLKESKNPNDIRVKISLAPSEYWLDHYRFDTISKTKSKKIGSTFIDNLILNSFIPILYAYGRHIGSEVYKKKALSWLEQLRPESNSILNDFKQINLLANNACESQALLELHNKYCISRKCTECAIGQKILGPH